MPSRAERRRLARESKRIVKHPRPHQKIVYVSEDFAFTEKRSRGVQLVAVDVCLDPQHMANLLNGLEFCDVRVGHKIQFANVYNFIFFVERQMSSSEFRTELKKRSVPTKGLIVRDEYVYLEVRLIAQGEKLEYVP